MKTFKLVSLQIVEQTGLKDIKLIDGLIINKEDEQRKWLIEAFTDVMYYDFLHDLFVKETSFSVQTVITRLENDPAPFEVTICSVQKMNGRMNVVMEGKLSKSRNEYAAFILQELVASGLGGEELLDAFKNRLQVKQPSSDDKKSDTEVRP